MSKPQFTQKQLYILPGHEIDLVENFGIWNYSDQNRICIKSLDFLLREESKIYRSISVTNI